MNGREETASGPSESLVWVITGTSSGLGSALVQVALARGDRVVATARNFESIRHFTSERVHHTHYSLTQYKVIYPQLRPSPCVVATARNIESIRHFTSDPKTAERVLIACLDVTAPFAEIRSLADEVVGKWECIDVLVNNAGVGMLGITEEVGVEGYKKQLDTNFFGPLNVTNAFLPYMRARRRAMAESLAVEVAPLGIKVLNVLPGGMRTQNWQKMTLLPTSPDSLLPTVAKTGITRQAGSEIIYRNGEMHTDGEAKERTDEYIADYAELRNRQIEWMNKVPCEGDAEKCARAIMDIVTGKKSWPELGLLVLGTDAEANIREKCNTVLRNLDEWKDVVRGVAVDK
ncbi:NAD-binding protein [Sanghuangporus baumii]|uniref:NAD-binding protein n=1 Tax=Sanghuangporus baumii TaxID=108892 RepID=A0A9Q5N418_SANBA|nr:NAD-binding protein [Sanghuangporus baumii]